MNLMPSPVDLRIWILSRTMGWPGRRIASEVGVSQPTVVRTLERLSKEPPTEQEIQDFVNVSTPPRGMPALPPPKPRPRKPSVQIPSGWITAGCVILVCLAVAAVLAGLTVRLINPAQAPAGQIACLRYSPNGSISHISTTVNGKCPSGQYPVTIIQNP